MLEPPRGRGEAQADRPPRVAVAVEGVEGLGELHMVDGHGGAAARVPGAAARERRPAR